MIDNQISCVITKARSWVNAKTKSRDWTSQSV